MLCHFQKVVLQYVHFSNYYHLRLILFYLPFTETYLEPSQTSMAETKRVKEVKYLEKQLHQIFPTGF